MKRIFYLLITILIFSFHPIVSSAQTITSFSPHVGTSGTTITIKGIGFSASGNVQVGKYNVIAAQLYGDTMYVGTIGSGGTGLISIISYTNGMLHTALSTDTFYYIPPVITDTLWSGVGQEGFSAGMVDRVTMAMNVESLPYVAYADKRNGNRATIKRLGENNNWETVGNAASAGGSSYNNIIVGSDGVPFIAYIDSANGNKISVERYTDGLWQYVGKPGFDTAINFSTAVAIALDSKNMPYVVSTSGSFPAYTIDVLKFNGSEWQSLGDVGFKTYFGEASIAIDKKTDDVYLYSTDNTNPVSYPVIIKKFSNGAWTTVGNKGFYPYAGSVHDLNIVTDSSGLPVVSMQSNSQISVYYFDGVKWMAAGNTNFSADLVRNVSLAIDSSNNLYVLFANNNYNNLGSVMTLSSANMYSGTWQYLGAEGFASSTYFNPNAIIVSKKGVPYIVFADTAHGQQATVKRYENYEQFTVRIAKGLYSQGDSGTCLPWQKEYPDWTTYNSDDTAGKHIEIQTQFQDTPGNICGFESYVDSSSTYRRQLFGDAAVVLSPRNYRIQFSDSNFTHPVGVRLFGEAKELDSLVAQAHKSGFPFGTDYIDIYRYDGPNEDYRPDNNLNGASVYQDSGIHFVSDYTVIHPTLHYYGTNNEYYYLEFYTNHFSEFYSGITTAVLLPVDLLSFSASLHDKMTSITWQTGNEVNASYFTVQRSMDGVYFINIGNVNAAGTGGNHTYMYRDDLSGITTSKIYYRLQMTDKDGSIKLSYIVSVDLSGTKLIAIHPNPTHSYALITCNVEGKKTIVITDMNGRKVFFKTTANSSEAVSVSSFAKGIYLVRIEYTGGFVVRKLVVE